MKYMFVSDIHGDISRFEEVINIFKNENADKLIILGDTASQYDDHDSIYMADILNSMSSKVEVIRGNCDTYEFENHLKFPIFDLDNLYISNRVITITHGHYYNSMELPPNCGEVFIQGHTHIPILNKNRDKIIANPGSVSRPRGVDFRCYIILDEEKIELKTLDGKTVKQIYF